MECEIDHDGEVDIDRLPALLGGAVFPLLDRIEGGLLEAQTRI